MSINLKDVDLSTMSGQFSLDVASTDFSKCSWLELINASPYTLYIQAGGLNFKIPAWYHYPFQLNVKNGPYWQPVKGVNFPVNITPKLFSANSSNLSTMLLPVLYLTGETPAVTTPQPLAHQTYIPNTVSTNLSIATFLQNDSSTLGNKGLIEATVVGDSSSAVSLSVGGVLSLGNSNRNGIIALNGPGSNIAAAQVLFGLGSISKLAAFGAYNVGTTAAFFNHNLGVVPDLILLQNVIGTVLAMVAYNDSTMTTTQVSLVASASCFVRGLAIKF